MKVLLLCGYRTSDHSEEPLGLARENGMILIDRRIVQLRKLGFEVVCVLAGSTAEEQLRRSEYMHTIELVYDTNEPCSLVSNVRAGSFAAAGGEACFVLPVELPIPDFPGVWNFLKNEYGKAGYATPYAFLQAVQNQGAPCHFGFPLLLTREGGKLLRQTGDLRSLLDTRLKTLHLEFPAQAVLEPSAKPL